MLSWPLLPFQIVPKFLLTQISHQVLQIVLILCSFQFKYSYSNKVTLARLFLELLIIEIIILTILHKDCAAAGKPSYTIVNLLTILLHLTFFFNLCSCKIKFIAYLFGRKKYNVNGKKGLCDSFLQYHVFRGLRYWQIHVF